MAKSKEAKATPKAPKNGFAKISKAKTEQSRPSNLSEEKVVDSDSDNDDTQYFTPETKSVSAKKATKASSKDVKAKSDSGSSDGEESEDDEESADETQKVQPMKPHTIPASVNGVKRKAAESEKEGTSSSEDEDEDEDSDSDKQQPETKKTKTAHTPDTSSSEEEEKSDEEESEEEGATQAGAVNGKEPQQLSSIQSIPAPPFEPPKGYSLLDTSKPMAAWPFTSSSLAGKQTWHLTAPSNVPVKHITEVALSSMQGTEPVLHHKGRDYVLARDKSHSTELDAILLPGTTGYTQAIQKVDEYFIIQQKLVLPDLAKLGGTGSKAAAQIATASVSTIRPQPKGLKMRYKPPGFGQGDPGRIGSSSDGEEDATLKSTAAQFPATLGGHGKFDKPDSQMSEKKKEKKKKRQSEDVQMVDAPVVNGTASMPPPSSTTSRKEKKRKEKSETPDRPMTASSQLSSEAVASSEQSGKLKKSSQEEGKVKESKEEKAKRKEAKRLKKETKMAKLNGV